MECRLRTSIRTSRLISNVPVMLIFLLVASAAFSQTALEKGEALFLENKMAEAKPFLETALNQAPHNERIYLYLATVYESLGQPDRAVTVLQRGIPYASNYLDVMYFNIGNNMFSQSKNVMAYEMFSKAIQVNPNFYQAYLNRANTAIQVENYEAAVRDYELYLARNPMSEQRESIEKVVGILRGVVEEQRRVAEERERIRREEENKRRELLESVRSSLSNASSSTTNLSAETEDVKTSDEVSDIID